MGKQVVIIDYQMGNVASVEKAFLRLGVDVKITNSRCDLEEADFLVLPGVGAFKDGMENLKKFDLVGVLKKQVLEKNVPFLGICLGMQLLADKSYEMGEHAGLGFVKGEVKKVHPHDSRLRMPHIGWNDVEVNETGGLFSNIDDHCFYFVHSYAMKPVDNKVVTSYCDYGGMFVSSIRQDNIFATQFHPEKSQKSGLTLLENFLLLRSR